MSDAHAAGAPRNAIAPRLMGVWMLVAYTEEPEGAAVRYPLGPQPKGILIYTADGFVSAQLMQPAMLPAPQEERNGYIAYCGRYEVDESQAIVTHIPIVALEPSWLSAKLCRRITLDADQLTLIAVKSPDANGPSAQHRLTWRRAQQVED